MDKRVAISTGNVVLIPPYEAKIAIESIEEFSKNNKKSSFKKIFFMVEPEREKLVYLISYKEALKIQLTRKEKLKKTKITKDLQKIIRDNDTLQHLTFNWEIGPEQARRFSDQQTKPLTDIDGVEIFVEQGNITEAKDIDAIVFSTNFELDLSRTRIGTALATADPEWAKIRGNKDFHEGKIRALITMTKQLWGKQGVSYIINAVGPEKTDKQSENTLRKTYEDILNVANSVRLKSLIFSPISSGISEEDNAGSVIITPIQEAQIAVSVIEAFIKNNEGHALQKIRFMSSEQNGLRHIIAFKEVLKIPLNEEEKGEQKRKKSQQEYKKLQQEYEKEWELQERRGYPEQQPKQSQGQATIENNPSFFRRMNFFRKMNKWQVLTMGTLATIAATSLYLLKKYYFSR